MDLWRSSLKKKLTLVVFFHISLLKTAYCYSHTFSKQLWQVWRNLQLVGCPRQMSWLTCWSRMCRVEMSTYISATGPLVLMVFSLEICIKIIAKTSSRETRNNKNDTSSTRRHGRHLVLTTAIINSTGLKPWNDPNHWRIAVVEKTVARAVIQDVTNVGLALLSPLLRLTDTVPPLSGARDV